MAYTRSIHEANIPLILTPCTQSFRLPYLLQSNIWRMVHDSLVNQTPCFIDVKDITCSECDTLIKECICLLSYPKTYYLCRKCCVQIWSHVQDSIF